jgi:hypothetical protein
MKKQLLTLSMILVLIASFSFLSAFAAAGELETVTITSDRATDGLAKPQVGDKLSLALKDSESGDVSKGVTYQWYAVEGTTTPTAAPTQKKISGATSKDFTLTAKEVGKYVVGVVVQAKGAVQEADADAGKTDSPAADVTKFGTTTGPVSAKLLDAVDGATLDIANETITVADSVTDKVWFRITNPETLAADTAPKLGNWKELAPVAEGGKEFNISKLLKTKDALLEIVAAGAAPEGKTTQATTKFFIKARPGKAAKPEIKDFAAASNTHEETEIGMTLDKLVGGAAGTGYEFKFNSGSEWTAVAEGATTITVPVGFTAGELWIRIKGTGEAKDGTTFDNAAQPGGPNIKFKVPAVTKAPAVKFDFVKGTLKVGGSKWEYSDNGGNATKFGDSTKVLTVDTSTNFTTGTVQFGYDKLKLRVAGTAKKPPSVWIDVVFNNNMSLIADPNLELDETSFAIPDGKKLVNAAGTKITEYLDSKSGKWKKGVPKLADIPEAADEKHTTDGLKIRVQGSKEFQFFADPTKVSFLHLDAGQYKIDGKAFAGTAIETQDPVQKDIVATFTNNATGTSGGGLDWDIVVTINTTNGKFVASPSADSFTLTGVADPQLTVTRQSDTAVKLSIGGSNGITNEGTYGLTVKADAFDSTGVIVTQVTAATE